MFKKLSDIAIIILIFCTIIQFMKKETQYRHVQIANDIMYYIYTHIDTHIDIEDLSRDLQVSKFHMHRIFKEAFGKNIYESIKSIRLQKASNLLITNTLSTISEIAAQCGYSSHGSFIRVFKERFGMGPREWRNGGYRLYSRYILNQSPWAANSTADFTGLEPVILKMPTMQCYYIRHKGYDVSINKIWQKLDTWSLANDLSEITHIGLYHDNPAITQSDECQYIACILDDGMPKKREGRLPKLTISSGIYAKFDIAGVYGDVHKFIRWVYHDWLPSSGYQTTTKPSYAVYKKNHFLSDDGAFELSFYVSIKY